jgi:hypothetical protein
VSFDPENLENLVETAARVTERYGDCIGDFHRARRELDKPALDVAAQGIIGSFIELAELDKTYQTGLGAVVVSELDGHKNLYLIRNGETGHVATVLDGGALYCWTEDDLHIPVAQVLTRPVRRILTIAETIAASTFLDDWVELVTGTLDAGEVFAYEGDFGGETRTARFVVMENWDGDKEILVSVPFARSSDDPSEGSLFPFSRVESRQARILARFLRHARAVSPPALVAATSEPPGPSL